MFDHYVMGGKTLPWMHADMRLSAATTTVYVSDSGKASAVAGFTIGTYRWPPTPLLGHAGYARLRPRLLSTGVELYEVRPDRVPHQRQLSPPRQASAKLHAKAIVVVRRQVLVGSMNLDPRSRHINTEVAVLINSTILGEGLITIFDEAIQPTHAYRLSMTDGSSTGRAISWTATEGGELVRHDAEPASAWRQVQAEMLFMFTPDDLL